MHRANYILVLITAAVAPCYYLLDLRIFFDHSFIMAVLKLWQTIAAEVSLWLIPDVAVPFLWMQITEGKVVDLQFCFVIQATGMGFWTQQHSLQAHCPYRILFAFILFAWNPVTRSHRISIALFLFCSHVHHIQPYWYSRAWMTHKHHIDPFSEWIQYVFLQGTHFWGGTHA